RRVRPAMQIANAPTIVRSARRSASPAEARTSKRYSHASATAESTARAVCSVAQVPSARTRRRARASARRFRSEASPAPPAAAGGGGGGASSSGGAVGQGTTGPGAQQGATALSQAHAARALAALAAPYTPSAPSLEQSGFDAWNGYLQRAWPEVRRLIDASL